MTGGEDPEKLVALYGGAEKLEAALETAAQQAIDALKAARQLEQALADLLDDWSLFALGDVARTAVDRLALLDELVEVTARLGEVKGRARRVQAIGRQRTPLAAPAAGDAGRRSWYQLVELARRSR